MSCKINYRYRKPENCSCCFYRPDAHQLTEHWRESRHWMENTSVSLKQFSSMSCALGNQWHSRLQVTENTSISNKSGTETIHLRSICKVTSISSSVSVRHIADLRSSVKIVFDSAEFMYSLMRHMKVPAVKHQSHTTTSVSACHWHPHYCCQSQSLLNQQQSTTACQQHNAASTHVTIHCVSKNVPPLTCYNLDTHDPITIIFGRSVTKKVGHQTMLCFPNSPIQWFCTTLWNRKPRNCIFSLKNFVIFPMNTQKHIQTRNVGHCPMWWSPCRIWVALSVQRCGLADAHY